MPIPKFTTLTCGAVPVVHENIDTDQIIPARFLTAVERKGFGVNLFRDWRYDKHDEVDIILNSSKGARVIYLGEDGYIRQ
jgi:3-isopropylmalate/(R)-2-methylmalate dehydratase small subunit